MKPDGPPLLYLPHSIDVFDHRNTLHATVADLSLPQIRNALLGQKTPELYSDSQLRR